MGHLFGIVFLSVVFWSCPLCAEPLMTGQDLVSGEIGLLRLVQAEDSARRLLDGLRRRGAWVVGAVAEDAYVVHLTREDQLHGLPGLRWQGPFLPTWKLAADLHRGQRKDQAVLRLFAWPGESFVALASRFGDLSHVEVLELLDDVAGTGHALIGVAPGRLDVLSLELAGWDEVAWVAGPRRIVLNNDDSSWVIQSGMPDSRPLFDQGLTGHGQVIGIADSGLDTDACQFRFGPDANEQTPYNSTQPPLANVTHPDNKVIAYYLLSGADAYDDRSKDAHGTHVSGCAAGDNYAHPASADEPGRDAQDGMAPAARIVFQDTGRRDGNQAGLPGSLVDMYTQAHASGAHVHNNSFGMTDPDTSYSGDSREVDQAAWRMPDMLIVFSAGNLGPDSESLDGIGSTSKNSLVVGASLSGARMGRGVCHFSSQGPTSDGRLRPDLVAPGAILSAAETDWIEQGGTDIFGQPTADSTTDPGNDNCAVDSLKRLGTSFSAPLVAGAAALAREYFVEGYYPSGQPVPADGLVPSAALLKAVLLNAAESIVGKLYNVTDEFFEIADLAPAPSQVQGWGLLKLDRSLFFPGDADRLAVLNDCWGDGQDRGAANQPALEEGLSHSFVLYGVSAARPLRLTLVWTDPAGVAGSGRALINDLDLECEDEAGQIYKGNVAMQNNRSQPAGAQAPDSINPAEQIILQLSSSQDLTLRVIGRDIPGNGQTSPYPSTRQGYALMASGDFESICFQPPCGDPPDSGLEDAGGEDAGEDAGGEDAGEDAGGQDAGTEDGGPGDAGETADGSTGPHGRIEGGCACGSGRGSGFGVLFLFAALLLLRLARRFSYD
ncbi:MAG: S8 family serine peptidase [Deltaproteobacteria bacterium]|nr:S8 family serine peptidase [Deltaproteobacteria bacterium]